MTPRFLYRLFDGLFWLGCALTMSALLVLPTRTFQTRTTWRLEPEWQGLVLFSALLLTGWAYWFRRRESEAGAAVEAFAPLAKLLPKQWHLVWLAAVVILLVRVGMSFDSPLGIDENRRLASFLENGPREGASLALRPLNHALVQFGSVLSMHWFGVSKLVARLPAMFVAFAFLLFLALWTRFTDRREASLLLLAQLSCNGIFLWFVHSTRGYLSMLLLTFPVLISAMKIARGEREMSAFHVWFFALAFLFAFVTQAFAVFFLLCLYGSLAAWLRLNRRSVLPIGYGVPVLVVSGVVTFGLLLPFSLRVFGSTAGPTTLGPLEVAQAFPLALGLISGWWGRCVLALAFGLTAIRWSQDDTTLKKDFLGWFLMLSMAAAALVIDMAKGAELAPRFLLAFLPAMVLWLAESATAIKGRLLAVVGWAAVLGLTLVAPAFQARVVTAGLSSGLRDFEAFVSDVRSRLAPAERSCLAFSGNPDLIKWASDFHLRRIASRADCMEFFLAHFGRNDLPNQSEAHWVPIPAGNWVLVARGENAQLLYKRAD